MAFRKYNFMKKFLDVLTGLIAFLTVILMLFLFICNRFRFFEGMTFLAVLDSVKYYAVYAVFFLAGLEFVSTKNWFLLIVFLLVAACAAIFLFAPQWVESFIGLFKRG